MGNWKNFVVCGMGGSALAGDLLRIAHNKSPIAIWRDYNLPAVDKDTLVITSSYSGNTEEIVSSFLEARKHGLPIIVITTGGKLLELATQHQVPYIQLPNTNIQPRMATGYMLKALAAATGLKQTSKEDIKNEILNELTQLATSLDVEAARKEGEALSKYLRGKIPIIYSSNRIFPVSYNWKIKFNETGKIPAFYNTFPELNHNEMTGFDSAAKDRVTHPLTPSLTLREGEKGEGFPPSPNFEVFHFIFLEDSEDDPRILKRMKVTGELLKARGFPTSNIPLLTSNIWHKIFQNLLTADWTAYYLAKYYGSDPEQVPMVEEFKKLIA